MNARKLLTSLLFLGMLACPLCAQETPETTETMEREVDFLSPDGRFAFLLTHQPDREVHRMCDLVEKKSGIVLLRVAESDEGKDRLGIRVLWSPDSKRFALCATHNHFGESLSVYYRKDGRFQESKLPKISEPDIPERLKHDQHEWKWTEIGSQEAQRWRRDGTLVVKVESTLQAINSDVTLTSERTMVLGFARPEAAKILRSSVQVARHAESR